VREFLRNEEDYDYLIRTSLLKDSSLGCRSLFLRLDFQSIQPNLEEYDPVLVAMVTCSVCTQRISSLTDADIDELTYEQEGHFVRVMLSW